MDYKPEVYGDCAYDSPIASNLNDLIESCQSSTVTLMQFTGLLDKNGREIYEGDIVELKTYYDPGVKKRRVGVVKFGKHYDADHYRQHFGFYVDFNNKDDIIDGYEVIGNLYENPKLLEEQ
jgi:uncharacterized phage protein (TIGR01671 family)